VNPSTFSNLFPSLEGNGALFLSGIRLRHPILRSKVDVTRWNKRPHSIAQLFLPPNSEALFCLTIPASPSFKSFLPIGDFQLRLYDARGFASYPNMSETEADLHLGRRRRTSSETRYTQGGKVPFKRIYFSTRWTVKLYCLHVTWGKLLLCSRSRLAHARGSFRQRKNCIWRQWRRRKARQGSGHAGGEEEMPLQFFDGKTFRRSQTREGMRIPFPHFKEGR